MADVCEAVGCFGLSESMHNVQVMNSWECKDYRGPEMCVHLEKCQYIWGKLTSKPHTKQLGM